MPQNRSVQDIINAFVNELTTALEAQTTAAIRGALGGEAPTSFGDKRTKSGRKARALKKGGKRSPEALEALTKSLLSTIKKNPGSNIEQLAGTMRISTKELTLPIKKLIDDKAIGRKGQKRGTRYTAR